MAPVICKPTRTAYFPAPKSASTTLRHVFFEIENGYPFRKFTISGREVDLFWLYGHGEMFKPVPVPEGFERFAVVRDPIERFVSFYKWGVIDNRCKFTAPVGINDFVANFAAYFKLTPMIHFHLSPQFKFIGRDLGYYHRIFRMEELAELGRYLSARAGRDITVGQVNSSTRKATPSDLTAASRARLAEIYAEDYALLKDYYSPGGLDRDSAAPLT